MKSNKQQLEQRGFLPKEFDIGAYNLTIEETRNLLKSKIPTDRTLAARLLSNEVDSLEIIDTLVCALIIEKKLYTKIEISDSLAKAGSAAVMPLIKQLGKIGANQHTIVPEKEFKKSSYPLPRDIAARILAHMGKDALPFLLTDLNNLPATQQSEAIDAIGFICFYNYTPNAFEVLKESYAKNKGNKLIQWKILRAFSSFPESMDFMEQEEVNIKNERLIKEIERSTTIIKERNYKPVKQKNEQ